MPSRGVVATARLNLSTNIADNLSDAAASTGAARRHAAGPTPPAAAPSGPASGAGEGSVLHLLVAPVGDPQQAGGDRDDLRHDRARPARRCRAESRCTLHH